MGMTKKQVSLPCLCVASATSTAIYDGTIPTYANKSFKGIYAAVEGRKKLTSDASSMTLTVLHKDKWQMSILVW